MKKRPKCYVVTHTIHAKSMSDAIKQSRTREPDEVYTREQESPQVDTWAVGFHADFPEEEEWDEEDDD